MLLLAAAGGQAATMDATDRWVYAANVGWLDAGGPDGLVVGEFHCSGRMYGANIGWISFSSGTPTNGHSFANDSGSDWGVNISGVTATGEAQLRGYAYGANIGWVAFEAGGDPRVSLATGRLAGRAWSANVGWIELGEFPLSARTILIERGPDADADGIPDAWEFAVAGKLSTLGSLTDADGDGQSDASEYAADTDPFSASDRLHLRIAGVGVGSAMVEFTSKPTRWYRVERTTSLATPATWADAGVGTVLADPVLPTTTVTVPSSGTTQFFRVEPRLPLEL